MELYEHGPVEFSSSLTNRLDRYDENPSELLDTICEVNPELDGTKVGEEFSWLDETVTTFFKFLGEGKSLFADSDLKTVELEELRAWEGLRLNRHFSVPLARVGTPNFTFTLLYCQNRVKTMVQTVDSDNVGTMPFVAFQNQCIVQTLDFFNQTLPKLPEIPDSQLPVFIRRIVPNPRNNDYSLARVKEARKKFGESHLGLELIIGLSREGLECVPGTGETDITFYQLDTALNRAEDFGGQLPFCSLTLANNVCDLVYTIDEEKKLNGFLVSPTFVEEFPYFPCEGASIEQFLHFWRKNAPKVNGTYDVEDDVLNQED